MPLEFFNPVSNIAPFTYRDGETYLQQLKRLRAWIDDVAVLSNGQFASIVEQFDAGVATILAASIDARNDADAATALAELMVTAQDDAVAALIAGLGEETKKALDLHFTYAPVPSGVDDYAVLQEMVDDLAAQNGGTLHLHEGAYKLSQPLLIKNKVIVRGQGRSATTIEPLFVFNSPYLIKLGDVEGLTFGSRLEQVTLECRGIVDTGVYSNHGQEMTGCSYIVVAEFEMYGIHFASGTDNFDVDNVELYPEPSGAIAGFYGVGNFGANRIARITCGVSGTLEAGIKLDGGTYQLNSIHCEKATDGIFFNGATGILMGATGPTAALVNGNLIHISNGTKTVSVMALNANGYLNLVKDDFNGVTIPSASNNQNALTFYSAAETYVGGFKFTPSGNTDAGFGGALRGTRNGGGNIIEGQHTNDPNTRFILTADGSMEWGPGDGGRDTSIRRSAPGKLRSGGMLIAEGGFGTSNFAAGGAMTNNITAKLPIHDQTGALVGYIPIHSG